MQTVDLGKVRGKQSVSALFLKVTRLRDSTKRAGGQYLEILRESEADVKRKRERRIGRIPSMRESLLPRSRRNGRQKIRTPTESEHVS